VVHCVYCGIRFLSHPRNARRTDLRCPFGCRRQHRRQRSQQRSAAYYRTTAGKAKKKRLNARRGFPSTPEPKPEAPIKQAISAGEPAQRPSSPNVELRLDGVVLNPESLLKSRMLPYVRMVVSLIEGIEFSYQELVMLLRQAMRQHSIASRTRSEYVLRFLHEHPP
jgi:hypothetical protein